MKEETIRLTQYTHGGGCGCKISPLMLESIIKKELDTKYYPALLIGNKTNDDAAVYDIGGGICILSTTDFFTPIVDNPFDFGYIASVNAINDIYAMGGKPIMALATLGWPVDLLDVDIAAKVMDGAKKACESVNIPIAGGHSIDTMEPIFGLAVTGISTIPNIKTNSHGKKNSILYLTKPLGIGIMANANKKMAADEKHFEEVKKLLYTFNTVGEFLGGQKYVEAMTDVTGFGFLGHLIELCEASDLSAEIDFDKIPILPFIDQYINDGFVTGSSDRNWDSYSEKVAPYLSKNQRVILTDPQTCGGLLIAVDVIFRIEFENFMRKHGYDLSPIGKLTPKNDTYIVKIKDPIVYKK
ncbi:MAG: selenide, water dikinase SelD [Chitinophagaceae bacterium]|nr:selenide, water dikinase SelD [Chitinophagaceae bacterium]